MKKRFTALFLSVMMLISIIPSPVFAQQTEEILPEEDVNAQIEEMIPAEENPQEIISVETTAETLLAASTVANGTCGTNLTWTLDSEGTLTISGTGKMTDWSNASSVPWYSKRSSVKSIVIEDGVTSIGKYAFRECIYLEELTIPLSVTSIGAYGYIRWDAYRSGPVHVYYAGSKDDWGQIDIGSNNDPIRYSDTKIHYNYVSGVCGDDLSWILSEDGVLVISGSGSMYDWDSEDEVPWYTHREYVTGFEISENVTNIGDYAFYGCTNLKNVVIRDSIARIGDYAFYGCNALESVVIVSDVSEICDYAFYGCSNLPSINIPVSVTFVGSKALSNCGKLSAVYYMGSEDDWRKVSGSSVVNETSADVHFGYVRGTSKNNITWKLDSNGILTISGSRMVVDDNTWSVYNKFVTTLVIENGVTDVDLYAFRALENITNAVIAGSVEFGYECAFAGCASLKNVVIGEGVTKIASNTFQGCNNLENLFIPKSMYSIGHTFYDCGPKNVYYAGSRDDWAGINISSDNDMLSSSTMHYDCEFGAVGGRLIWALKSDGTLLIMCEGNMPDWEYEANIPWKHLRESIKSVEIGDTVTSIGKHAFLWCVELKEIYISGGIKTIGDSAFDSCMSLEKVEMAEGVTSIGSGSFSDCESLKNITLPASLTKIGDNAFIRCTSLEKINVADGNTAFSSDEKGILYNKDKTRLIVCPQGVTGDIVIPAGVKDIDDYAFFLCKGITGIVIPEGVTELGNFVMSGCSLLSEINIPENVRTIGNSAFSGCSSLKGLMLTGNVSDIGLSAFSSCNALEYIGIPASVVSLGYNAFDLCESLVDVYYEGSIDEWNELADEGVWGSTSTESVHIHCDTYFGYLAEGMIWTLGPSGMLHIIGSGNMYDWSSSDDVAWIEHSAAVTSVLIDSGVTSIGDYAFAGCSNISDIYYGGSEEEWKNISAGTNNEILSDTSVMLHYNSSEGGHTKEETQVSAANCNEPAKYKIVCKDCSSESAEYTKGDALGHTEVTDEGYDPDCTNTGLTEGKHCSVCDEVLVEQTVIPAKGHSWDEGTPDAENPEVKTFTCTVCGETVEGTKAFLFMMKIDEFDDVEITHAHEETVLALKAEYEALSDEEQSLVENYDELETLIKTFEHYHKGDIDLSGTINSSDLSELLSAYGTGEGIADISGDGVVNSTDLSELLSNYGSSRL